MRILVYKPKNLNYLTISLLFFLCQQVLQVIGISRTFNEIITDPITLNAKDNRIIQHADLPVVTDEVSVTLRLNIQIHGPSWACVFHKGIARNSQNLFPTFK